MNPESLKIIRKKLNLTQKQIAEIIEVSDKTWQQWESGKSPMHIAFFNLLKERVSHKIDFENLEENKGTEKNITVFKEYSQNQITKNS